MNQLELIQSKIYEIRGQRVMLDFDLAELYQVETRVQLELINQTLAELQVHKKLSNKPRRPIGFIRPQED